MAGIDERLTLQPISDQDHDFLFHLYASTREEELRPVPWSQEEKIDFLKMQFRAQHQHYSTVYESATFDLILLDQERIGRLYVDRWETEIRIIDIAIIPDKQGQGIGSYWMNRLIEESDAASLPLNIHVEHNNPAQRLYKRLGFQKVGETGVYHLMQREPQLVSESQSI